MIKLNQIYKCELCGSVVEVTRGGQGSLKCCGEDMLVMKENIVDAATEKHIPVVKIDGNVCKVSVGSTLHPMTDEHLIEWIEVIDGKKIQRKQLKKTPEADFVIEGKNPTVRAFCNLHGLWKA